MSDFDRNAGARWGQGVARAGRAEIDQGLRSYMLGVYNNMVVGLALTGLVALGVNMLAVTTDPSQAAAQMGRISLTPLRRGALRQPAALCRDAGAARLRVLLLVPHQPDVGVVRAQHFSSPSRR